MLPSDSRSGALRRAPEWQTTRWFNSDGPLTLAELRGNVVLLHAFQMLCPGCVARGIPQAQRVFEAFRGAPLMVIGIHTVFEHHAAMNPDALSAFLSEYRIRFPVAVDAPSAEGGVPQTMLAYQMQGTPTTVLIDGNGRIRRQVFGTHDDLLLGAEIGTLLATLDRSDSRANSDEHGSPAACDDHGCALPLGS